MSFENKLTIQKLKIANNISDIREKLANTFPSDSDYKKNECLLWELKAYYKGLEFAQELYYTEGE